MRIFVTSDHHFGQENFHYYSQHYDDTMRPEFKNATDWANNYIEVHNNIVPENESIVYFLGDIAKNITWAERIFTQLNGEQKVLVMGNHDNKYPTFRLQNLFDKIMGCAVLRNSKSKYILTHVPVHPAELRDCVNIHGHTHKNTIQDSRYVNACVDYLKEPMELEVI